MMHSQHQPAGKRMSIQHRDGRHREGQEAQKELVEGRGEEGRVGHGVLEVEAVGVELWDGAGGEDDARGVGAEFEDVEGGEEGGVEGGGEAVVGGGG